MSTYSIKLRNTLRLVVTDHYRMIEMEITNVDENFRVRSQKEFLRVTDGVTVVKPIDFYYTPSRKKLMGYFTMDGFASFSGDVDAIFGFGSEVDGTVTVTNLNANIDPLPPILAGIPFLDATNVWLSQL